MSANGYIVEVFSVDRWGIASDFRPLQIDKAHFADVGNAIKLAKTASAQWRELPFRVLSDKEVVAEFKNGERVQRRQ